jgi:acetolactate synthase I/II/III large subunit
MKVYEALARAFAAEGTTAVFDLMGDANMHWLNALDRLGVEIFDVRHEGAGLAMADGWARARGQPGVCSTTSGPGTAQLATTMVVASRARTPLVAFCGDTAWGDELDAQHFDQERFAAAVEAGFVRLTSADAAYATVQRAFYEARLESRPIMLSVPSDTQMQDFDDGAVYTPSTAILPTAAVQPEPDRIAAAAVVVAASERPVVLVGRGAQHAGAGEVAVRLADRLGALIATTLHAKNWMTDADFHVGVSGGYATRTARELFKQADCVVAAGTSLSSYTTERGALFGNARIVQFDRAPHRLMGDGRAADVYVQSDARVGLEALERRLDGRPPATGFRTPAVAERIATAWDDDEVYELEPGTVDPRAACRVLDAAIPPGFGLVLGSGQQVRFGTMLLRRERPRIVAQHHFGCIGQGLTTAMGVAIADDRRPTFVVEGDAGFMMHLAEFETAVRYDLPLLVVVMNDQGLGAEYHKSLAIGLDGRLALIPTPDLGAVAAAMGGRGALVRSLDDLADAVAGFVASPAPTVLDVRISRTVLSIPYQRAFHGRDV